MTGIDWKEIAKAAGFIIFPNLGGLAGGFLTKGNMGWYDTLKKPPGTPPKWVFGPVWTTLYCGIGLGSYLVYRNGEGFNSRTAIPFGLYGANLILNWAWTPIYFGLHSLKWSFYEINLITGTAIATGVTFYKYSRWAGCLFIPYVMWLGLATYLNYRTWVDNVDADDGSKIN